MRTLVTTMKLWIHPGRRPTAATLLGVAAMIGSVLLLAVPAAADCTLSGSTVTCTGSAAGYGTGTEDDLIVDIQSGALVTVSAPAEGFKLNSGNQIDNTGTIDVTGANAIGIDLNGTANVVNSGTAADSTPIIRVTGDDAIGIRDQGSALGTTTGVTINNWGRLEVSGTGAAGIVAGENAIIINEVGAVLDITAGGRVGIETGAKDASWVNQGNGVLNPAVRNGGVINVGADGAIGIKVGDGMEAYNEPGASLNVTGVGSIGIQGGDNGAVSNDGSLIVDGTSAVGVEVGNWTTPAPGSERENWANQVGSRTGSTVEVSGDGAFGFRIGNGWTLPDAPLPFAVLLGGDMRVVGVGATGFEVGDDSAMVYASASLTPRTTLVQGTDAVGFDLGLNSLFDSEEIIGVDAAGANAIRIGANDGSDPDFVTITNANLLSGGLEERGSQHDALIVFKQPEDPMQGVNRLLNRDVRQVESRSRIEARIDGIAIQGTDPRLDAGVPVGGSEFITNELGAWIHGTMDLRGGDDVVENLAGIITGEIRLGDGDDLFRHMPGGELERTIYLIEPSEEVELYAEIYGGAGSDEIELMAGQQLQSFELDRTFEVEQITLLDDDDDTNSAVSRWVLSGTSDGFLQEVRVETNSMLAWTNFLDPDTNLPATTPPSIEGELVFEPDSNFLVLLDPANPDDPSTPNLFLESPISANGQATLDGTAELLLTQGSDDLLFRIITQGDIEVRVLDAAFISGRFSDIAPPSSLYRLTSAYDDPAGTLDIILEFISFTESAATPNQNSVATHLDDTIGYVNSGALADLMSALLALDDEGLEAAYDQLHPEAYDAHTSAMLAMGNRFTRAMLERPRLCVVGTGESRRDPVTGLVCRPRKWEPWAEGYGQLRTLTGDTGHISHEDTGGGGLFGLDHRLNPALRLTGTIGGGTSSIDVTDVGPGSVTTIDTGLAASWRRGPLRVQGAFSYSHGSHELSREMNIGEFHRKTNTRYTSNRIGLRAESDYVFGLSGWNLAPLASLDYTALLREGVQELGAGQAGLLIEDGSDSVVTIRAGLAITPTFKKSDYWTDFLEFTDGVWRPRLGVSWRQVVSGQDRTLTSRFIGADASVPNFVVSGADADQGFEISAGFEFTPARANRITLGVFYDGFLWSNVQSHDFGASLKFAF